VTWNEVRKLAFAWPGMADSTSYGTALLKVNGKIAARLRDDGETIAFRVDVLEHQERNAADPGFAWSTSRGYRSPT